jgi:hypothetical protein
MLTVAATSTGATFSASLNSTGLTGDLDLPTGDGATFASDVTFTGTTSFQEIGKIAFGAGHGLRFSTIGTGYLGSSPDPSRRHGVVSWRVDGGEGVFAGAHGLITSNVLIGEDLEVVDHQYGVLFMP